MCLRDALTRRNNIISDLQGTRGNLDECHLYSRKLLTNGVNHFFWLRQRKEDQEEFRCIIFRHWHSEWLNRDRFSWKRERIEGENVQGWDLWLYLSVLIEVPCSRVDDRGKSLRGDTAMSLVQFTESTHSNTSFYQLIESIY